MPDQQPKLDRLISQLVTSGIQRENPALYQVIEQLIKATKQLQGILVADVAAASSASSGIKDRDYLTHTDESADLPNSRQLLAGTSVTFDDTVVNERTINVTDTGITELTGDVTAGPGSGSQAATIANEAVTYAKIQNVSTTDRLLGRFSPGAGDVEEISLGADLSIVAGVLEVSGIIPAEDQGYWSPLTDGDPIETELVFASAEAIMVWVATP